MRTRLAQVLAAEIAQVAARARDWVVAVRAGGHGGGSGVIWSADGLVVTNHHVARFSRAEIVLPDGQRVSGQVVQRAPDHDLAVLRIAAPGPLRPARPRAVETLRVGEIALAVGNPLGQRGAVAFGLVTGLGRATWTGQQPSPVIVADLTLYPGNSGGALLDAEGRLLGLTTMVMPPGIALAVPASTVAALLREWGLAED